MADVENAAASQTNRSVKLIGRAFIAAALLGATSTLDAAHAQWQVPTNAVPYGKAVGVTGYGAAGPGTNNGISILLDELDTCRA
jgi:hypothetical protein